MLLDHIGFYLLPKLFFIRVIGRVSMPIYVILFGISYKKQNNQLLWWGLITQVIEAYLNRSYLPINLLFTMYLMGFVLNSISERYASHGKKLFIFFLILLFPLSVLSAYFIEYGLIILYLMFFGVLLKKENKDKYDKITIGIIYFVIFLYDCLEVGYIPVYCIPVGIYLLGLFYYLINNYKTLKDRVVIENKIARNTVLICSRYSLYLYTLHILILILIKKCLL
jgi:hypothetical protein